MEMFLSNCTTDIRCTPRCSHIGHQCSPTCRHRSQTSCWHSHVFPGAHKVLSGAPRCSQTYQNHSHGTPVLVIGYSSYSEGQLECPPSVIYCSSPVMEDVPPRRDRSIRGVPPSVTGLVHSRSVPLHPTSVKGLVYLLF
jgi:hypothetical protein